VARRRTSCEAISLCTTVVTDSRHKNLSLRVDRRHNTFLTRRQWHASDVYILLIIYRAATRRVVNTISETYRACALYRMTHSTPTRFYGRLVHLSVRHTRTHIVSSSPIILVLYLKHLRRNSDGGHSRRMWGATRSSAVAETAQRFMSLNILLSHSRHYE